jgi:DNA-binding transcriptional ArsR family regulator
MEVKDAVGALGALAQDTRLAAFRALVEAGPAGLAAGALAAKLDVPPPTLSFHLTALANAGLVTARRDGRSIVYAADFAAMTALLGFLTDQCCGGDPGACLPSPLSPAKPKPARRRIPA